MDQASVFGRKSHQKRNIIIREEAKTKLNPTSAVSIPKNSKLWFWFIMNLNTNSFLTNIKKQLLATNWVFGLKVCSWTWFTILGDQKWASPKPSEGEGKAIVRKCLRQSESYQMIFWLDPLCAPPLLFLTSLSKASHKSNEKSSSLGCDDRVMLLGDLNINLPTGEKDWGGLSVSSWPKNSIHSSVISFIDKIWTCQRWWNQEHIRLLDA